MKKRVWMFVRGLIVKASFAVCCLTVFDVAAARDKDTIGGNHDRESRVAFEQQSTQFFMAAMAGDVDNIRKLVDQGMQVDCTDEVVDTWSTPSRYKGYTALHYAARAGHLKAVEALLDLGAKVDIVAPFDGTALHAATKYNKDFGVSRVLLRAGASPGVRNGGHFETPL